MGVRVQHVAETDRPVVIQRYKATGVVMVPLWEWRWLKEIEDKVRRGEPIIELCRDVARLELTGSPLYIVTQTMLPPILGATTVCYGYASPS